jgi:preprotein translocase subunit YajC
MENAQNVAQVAPNSTIGMIIWCLVIFGVMYLLMIRPNKKRMDEYKKMLDALRVGSKIICAGGIYGVIKEMTEKTLKVEIADGVVIEIPKSAVGNIA